MRNLTREEEKALHERVLRRKGDPMASVDVFMIYMDLLARALERSFKDSDEHMRYDALSDVLWSYLGHPERYDPGRGAPLSLYLLKAARYRMVDKLRTGRTSALRDEKFATAVELGARTPKDEMEDSVEAKRAWEQLMKEGKLKDPRDEEAIRLILAGERSTDVLARIWGVTSSSRDEMQKKVKQKRDRVMKLLKRSGKEKADDESDES